MRAIKYSLIIVFAVFLTTELALSQISFPPDNIVRGWQKTGEERYFSKETLFNYINGGAEIFLEFGFRNLTIQAYKKGKNELSLNVYQMENADAALGIYLNRCGKETALPKIQARNSYHPYQLTLVKGRYFIQIDNFSGDRKNRPVMEKMARFLTGQIKIKEEPRVLSILPVENMIPGSEMIIRGPYALQSVYTFGKGDILQLEGNIFAAAADYNNGWGYVFTRLFISYPSAQKAQQAFINLRSNLDSYLKIISQQTDAFYFVDFRQKYGRIALSKNIMEIEVNHKHLPGEK